MGRETGLRGIGRVVFFWGVGGVLAILFNAIFRLWPVVKEALAMDLTALQWAGLILSVAFLGYAEGYKAFQRGFSPRVVARALALGRRPQLLRAVLAPIFCMQLFGAVRRRLIVSWCVTLGVFGLILWVRSLPQPWRGIVDAGVVVALSWGSGAILWFSWWALSGRPLSVSDDIPGPNR